MDVITIKGQAYRVCANFNALMGFMDLHGYKDFTFLNEDIGYPGWYELMLLSINEGERIEGKKHDYTKDDFSEVSAVEMLGVITSFIAIFNKQNASEQTATQKGTKAKKA